MWTRTRATSAWSEPRPAASFGRGFTLLETVLSLAVMSIILGAIAMALVSSAGALESGRDENAARSAASAILSETADELRTASKVLSRDNAGLAVEVPDRDGDGRDEVIRYSWAGTTIQRKVNDSAWQDLSLSGVKLRVTPVVVQKPAPTVQVTGSQMFANHVGTSGGSSAEVRVGPEGYVAQYVRPTLGRSVYRWRPERVRLLLRRNFWGDGKALLVAVSEATPGLRPGERLVGVGTVSEGSVGLGNGWASINLQNTDWVPAGSAVVVCVWSVDTSLLSMGVGGLAGGLLGIGGSGALLNVGAPTGNVSTQGAIYVQYESGGTPHTGLAMHRAETEDAWQLESPGTDLFMQLTGSIEEVTP